MARQAHRYQLKWDGLKPAPTHEKKASEFAVDAVGDDGADLFEVFDPGGVVLVGAELGFGFGEGDDVGVFDDGDDGSRFVASVAALVDVNVRGDAGLLDELLAGFDGLGVGGGIVGFDHDNADDGGLLLREGGGG